MSQRDPNKVLAWQATIDAWKESDQTINAFCRDRNLTRSNFDRWRRILSSATRESKPSPSPAFVPLRVVVEPMVEVVLTSGMIVRLPLNTAPEAVTQLVVAVGAAGC